MRRRVPGIEPAGLIAFIALIAVVASIVLVLVSWPTPDISAEPEKVDMGTIPQQLKIVTVTIKNDGNTDPKISRLTTSWMCTSVVLQLGGRTSPTFAGPDPSAIWASETLSPRQSGTLEKTYNPALFQDQGPTVRYVHVTSNDPGTP